MSNRTTFSRTGFRLLPSVIIVVFQAAVLGGEMDADYTETVNRFKQLAEAEIERGILTGVSVSLVDDQRCVCAAGFGWADRAKRKPATRKTVYRAGSISKLFTALATMQLVEQGKLNLDEPIVTYWPDFRIVDPLDDAQPITLRQLMCHRSGLVRESPVGGYLDPGEPSIAASVASLADCVLVHPPNTKTKYSNIGVTVVGHVVAQGRANRLSSISGSTCWDRSACPVRRSRPTKRFASIWPRAICRWPTAKAVFGQSRVLVSNLGRSQPGICTHRPTI